MSSTKRSPHRTTTSLRLPAEPGADDGPLRFGDWLVRRRLISRGELFSVLKRAYRCGYRIGDAVVTLGLLDRGAVEDEAQALQSYNAFCGQYSTWLTRPN